MCLFYLYKSAVNNSLSIVYTQEDKKDFIRRWKIKPVLRNQKKTWKIYLFRHNR